MNFRDEVVYSSTSSSTRSNIFLPVFLRLTVNFQDKEHPEPDNLPENQREPIHNAPKEKSAMSHDKSHPLRDKEKEKEKDKDKEKEGNLEDTGPAETSSTRRTASMWTPEEKDNFMSCFKVFHQSTSFPPNPCSIFACSWDTTVNHLYDLLGNV